MLIGINKDDAAEYSSTIMDRLKHEIEESHCQTIIFSNEHLSSRLRNPASINKLIISLREMADDVRVIVYLRPQYELFPSWHSTSVKAGGVTEAKAPTGTNWHFYNYDMLLSKWEQSVGLSNMLVRRFGKAYLKHGNLIEDFFDLAGVAIPEGLVAPKAINPALDAHTLEFLRLANPFLPAPPVGGGERERIPFIEALEKLSVRNSPVVSADILRDIDKTFHESNESVARRYFPDLNGELFAPYALPDGEQIPELTVVKAVEIAVQLWRLKSEELKEVRARAKQAKAEAAQRRPPGRS